MAINYTKATWVNGAPPALSEVDWPELPQPPLVPEYPEPPKPEV